MFMFLFIFMILFGRIKWKRICVVFHRVYKSRREAWNPTKQYNLITFFSRSKPEPGFPTSYVVVCFMFKWVEVRGHCSFCWYWWNCWPSLFNLSFHNTLDEMILCAVVLDMVVSTVVCFIMCLYFWYILFWIEHVFLYNIHSILLKLDSPR